MLLLSLTSCDSLKERLYSDGYPIGLTNEYCLENYKLLGNNFKHLQCDERIVENKLYVDGVYAVGFRKINEEDPRCVMLAEVFTEIVPYTDIKHYRVVTHEAYDVSPLEDWHIYKIELYWSDYMTTDNLNWGNEQYKEQFCDVSKYEDEILDAITGGWMTPTEPPYSISKEGTSYYLNMRIYFEGHKNIVWDSEIYVDKDGNYFFGCNESGIKGIESLTDSGTLRVAPVPEKIEQIIFNKLN